MGATWAPSAWGQEAPANLGAAQPPALIVGSSHPQGNHKRRIHNSVSKFIWHQSICKPKAGVAAAHYFQIWKGQAETITSTPTSTSTATPTPEPKSTYLHLIYIYLSIYQFTNKSLALGPMNSGEMLFLNLCLNIAVSYQPLIMFQVSDSHLRIYFYYYY